MGIYSDIQLDEVNEILNYYDLGPASHFEPTVTGISNSNFKVFLASGKEVLLKISNDKTFEQLTNEQIILSALSKYKYPYALIPFKTSLGKKIYRHNDYHGVVFPFVNGKAPKISLNTCEKLGDALGLLHSLEIGKEDLSLIRPHDLVGHSGVSIYEYTKSSSAPLDFVQAFNDLVLNQYDMIPFDLFPKGIIHGDLYYDNSLFDDDKLITLIDFEQAGRGSFLLDIGISISGTCYNSSKDNLDINLIRGYLDAYSKRRKLMAIEKDFLKTAIIVGFFSISLWRIKRFYEGNLDHTKKYNYRELLDRAYAFNQLSLSI